MVVERGRVLVVVEVDIAIVVVVLPAVVVAPFSHPKDEFRMNKPPTTYDTHHGLGLDVHFLEKLSSVNWLDTNEEF
jgi:hypothetical protein